MKLNTLSLTIVLVVWLCSFVLYSKNSQLC